MIHFRQFAWVVCSAVLVLLFSPGPAAGQGVGAESPGSSGSSLTSAVDPAAGVLEWRFKGRRLLVYSYGASQYKPYVRELYSLTGENLLRDAPEDHLHHHGLMYAVRVNGINFWEEVGQPGHQVHVSLVSHPIGRSPGGLPQARFTEVLHWVRHGEHQGPDTAALALLVERRTITMTVDETKREVALDWLAEFEVGVRTNHVVLQGAEYNGLGLRLPASWDHVAHHLNSEGTPYPAAGKPGAVPARWGAVSHTDGKGRGLQLALFSHPQGRGGIASSFGMTEPFTYLAVTQGLDKTPLEYRTGDRFAIRQRLTLRPEVRGADQLESDYQAWTAERK